jgi:hypothetical protein
VIAKAKLGLQDKEVVTLILQGQQISSGAPVKLEGTDTVNVVNTAAIIP